MTRDPLDELITLDEAGEIIGRAPVSLREAARKGKLRARRMGTGPGSVWITTRADVAEYQAYVADVAWSRQPQHRRPRAPSD
jgi:hypothetical protein